MHAFDIATQNLHFPCLHVKCRIRVSENIHLGGTFFKSSIFSDPKCLLYVDKRPKTYRESYIDNNNSKPTILSLVQRFCIFIRRYLFPDIRVNVKRSTKGNLLNLPETLNTWINYINNSISCTWSMWTTGVDKRTEPDCLAFNEHDFHCD